MDNTKYTKGKWIVNKGVIKTENGETIGFAADLVGRVDETRLPGEVWLRMMDRVQPEKNLCVAEKHANALLISKAPEMLEMLKSILELQRKNYGNGMDTHLAMIDKAKEIEQLLKSATEI